MKNLLYIIIGLNIVGGGGKAFADNSLTGLHLGFGLNVSSDEYKSDVDVLGGEKYDDGLGGKWTFTGLENMVTVSGRYKLGEQQNGVLVSGTKDCNIEITPQGEVPRFISTKYKYYNSANGYWEISNSSINPHDAPLKEASISFIDTDTVELNNVPLHSQDGWLTTEIMEKILCHKESEDKTIRDICDDTLLTELDIKYPSIGDRKVHYISPDKIMCLNSSRRLKSTRINGEIKASYFFKLFNNIIAGVDVSGTVSPRTTKNVESYKLNGKVNDAKYDISKSTYNIVIDGDDFRPDKEGYVEYKPIEGSGTYGFFSAGGALFRYNNGKEFKNASTINFFKTTYDTTYYFPDRPTGYAYTGVLVIPKLDYVIEEFPSVEIPANTHEFKAANPGYTEISLPEDLSQYLQISNEKGGDVTFEKNKFNSRAAVVLGAQYKGWFAGIRGGVSYNQGKIHAKDATGTSTEDVSFASPFVGVHLMKSINMKGLENGHIYLTADVNVQNKQNLKMKGIKNFRQNSVNVSLGMTWQIN